MSHANAAPNARLMAKMSAMLALQAEINSRVDPDWQARGREWYRAIWIECAELMDHYGGWKWWKASHRDVEQAMLEIVDIWHFGLSIRIRADRDHARAAAEIVEEWLQPQPSRGFLCDVETLARHALETREFLVAMVPSLLADIGRDFDALYRAYMGKNVLNFFRQDHGYKTGTYLKTWHDREDNAHLVEILEGLDSNAPGFRDDVYRALVARYPCPI